MKTRDVVISGGSAWEIVRIEDGGRQAHVKLLAGAGTESRLNDVPAELLTGQPLYRRVSELADIDVKRAADEVGRYVDVDGCSWHPRNWVEEFHRKYPAGTQVPDSTTMLGWFSRLIDAGEARLKAQQEAEAHQVLLTKKRKAAAKTRIAKAKRKTPIKGKAVKKKPIRKAKWAESLQISM
jgi:hypothetical protein